ncbi:hypothetical protein FS749_002119 [Ceratobasidium sp. UAMH 11750]|nr:hypothetical protein FS749_002119 [Ceratobasidium sp. UAMH 11750]
MPSPSSPPTDDLILDKYYPMKTSRLHDEIHAVQFLSVSPGNRWVLISMTGREGHFMIVTDCAGLTLLRVHISRDKLMTCIVWDKDQGFFCGFSDGTTCLCRVQAQGAGNIGGRIKLVPICVATFTTGGPITAIAKFYVHTGGYLAVSNSREVALTRGGPASEVLTKARIALFKPFDNPHSKVTGLLFSSHGPGQLKLIVSGSDGLVIYLIRPTTMLEIFRGEGFNIGSSAISNDGWYLALSTRDQILKYVKLETNGPVPESIHCLKVADGFNSITPIAFAAADCVVAGFSSGEMHFIDVAGHNHRRMDFSKDYGILAVAASGNRLYTVGISKLMFGRVALITYSRSVRDLIQAHSAPGPST